MATLDDLLAQVDSLEPDIVKLEQQLVRIPSVNTGFMPTASMKITSVSRLLTLSGTSSALPPSLITT